MQANQIIVALDGMDREEALMLAWTLSSTVWGFKVNDLLLSCGVSIVSELKCLGRVFADPKLYDIPKTVGNGVRRLAHAGADLITVHASGGRRMMQEAVANCGDAKILAVTALTSLDDAEVQDVYHRSVDEQVWDLAHLAHQSGAHGVVCSSREVKLLEHLNFIKVVPGIRLRAADGDDQKRTGTGGGADLFVVGRPIVEASDPLKAIADIVQGVSQDAINQQHVR